MKLCVIPVLSSCHTNNLHNLPTSPMGEALSHKIDAAATDLSSHRRDTEAHGAKWQVREKDE
jgi:hypothetical protein